MRTWLRSSSSNSHKPSSDIFNFFGTEGVETGVVVMSTKESVGKLVLSKLF